MDYNAILDFGENPVTDVDTKLKILKFDYSWVDAVEEEARRLEEEQKQKIEMKKKLEKEIAEKKNDNANDNRVATPLDFGDEVVKNWEAKSAEKRVQKEGNKTNNTSFGRTLTKDLAKSHMEENKTKNTGN